MEATARNTQMQNGDYCSQIRIPLPPFRTIETGVAVIEEILKKSVLCQHDVQDINRVYRAIDFLERRASPPIPEHDSDYVLKQIIFQRNKMNQNGHSNASALISLYHLREFLDEDLRIRDCFTSVSIRFKQSPNKNLEEVATHLPCCSSEADFDRDVTSLIGNDHSDKTTKILEQKKQKLRRYNDIKQKLQRDSQNYPAYFGTLLGCGHINLCDYLIDKIDMDEKALVDFDNGLSFIEFSHILLQTKNAILEKVSKHDVPPDSKIVFIFGVSGVGKSTTLCFLRGDEMEETLNGEYTSGQGSDIIEPNKKKSGQFLPAIAHSNGIFIIDCPGIIDTNGPIISLGIRLALKTLIRQHSSRILGLQSLQGLDQIRESQEKSPLGQWLKKLVVDTKTCLVGITRYSGNGFFAKTRTLQVELEILNIKMLELKEENRVGLTALQKKEHDLIKKKGMILKSPDNSELQDVLQEDVASLEKEIKALIEKIEGTEAIKNRKTSESNGKKDELQEASAMLLLDEEMLCQYIGITPAAGLVRLDNLKNPKCRSDCFDVLLQESEAVKVSSDKPYLGKDDEKRLEFQLNREIDELLKKDDYSHISIYDFEKAILSDDFDLIKLMFKKSSSKIAELFDLLKECDPNWAGKYEKSKKETCIKGYAQSVTSNERLTWTQLLDNPGPKGSDMFSEEIKTARYLSQQIDTLITKITDPTGESYTSALKKRSKSAEAAEDLSLIYKIYLGAINWRADFKKARQHASDYDARLTKLFNTVSLLYDMQKIVKDSQRFDATWESMQTLLSDDNISNINRENSIAQEIQNWYEKDLWDTRVETWAKQLKLSNFKPSNDKDYIIAYARALITKADKPQAVDITITLKEELDIFLDKFIKPHSHNLTRILVVSALINVMHDRIEKELLKEEAARTSSPTPQSGAMRLAQASPREPSRQGGRTQSSAPSSRNPSPPPVDTTPAPASPKEPPQQSGETQSETNSITLTQALLLAPLAIVGAILSGFGEKSSDDDSQQNGGAQSLPVSSANTQAQAPVPVSTATVREAVLGRQEASNSASLSVNIDRPLDTRSWSEITHNAISIAVNPPDSNFRIQLSQPQEAPEKALAH